MKNYLSFLMIFSLAFLFACNKKNAEKVQETVTTETEVEEPTSEIPTTKEVYEMAFMKKTACFGRCPVYEVSINSDGNATYHGKMNVKKMGMHQATVKPETLIEIRDKFYEMKFFDFHPNYPIDTTVKIMDLPTTVIKARFGDMTKEIVDKHSAPKELNDLESWFEEKINSFEWVKIVEGKGK